MLAVLEQAALRTLLLAGVVQLGLWMLRVERPNLRLTAWTVVLVAALAMPGLQWATPLHLPVLPNLPSVALAPAPVSAQQAVVARASVPVTFEASAPPALAGLSWLEGLYLLVCGIMLTRLALGIVLSLRLLGRALPVRAAWARPGEVRVSREVAAPLTIAHVILLPLDAIGWPAPMRDAVLAHERAHIARWDFAMLLASQLNRAVFWFSPLSWWLHRRLATLAEQASDDQAMQITGDRPFYAEVLLEMGRRSGPLVQGLAMARPATLQGRIERIVLGHVTTSAASPMQQVTLASLAIGLSVAAASTSPTPAATPATLTQPVTSASLVPQPPAIDPLAPAPILAPVQAPSGEAAFQGQPPSHIVARPPPPSALPPVAQVVAHQPGRKTLPPPPSRPLAERVRTDRGPGVPAALPRPAAMVSAGYAPHMTEDHVPRSVVGTADQALVLRQAAPPAAAKPTLARRLEDPSCTGVYLPKPGVPRTDGAADIVQAKYFQETDGTPWLKLFLGARTRATLSGLEVERIQIRTIVLTRLPRGPARLTGTTQGPYGTIDYACADPSARL